MDPLRHAGWTNSQLVKWLPLLQPKKSTFLPPERIVCVLGAKDNVTPHGSGLDLVRNWRVSANNVFIKENGHFTTSIGLLRDISPLIQLRKALLT